MMRDTTLTKKQQTAPPEGAFKGFAVRSRTLENDTDRGLCERFVFTPVPDQVLALLPDLSSSELKVLLYIIKRTLGFNKLYDSISQQQFLTGIRTKAGKQLDRGAGVSKNSLHRALSSLMHKGMISKTSHKAANGKDLSCRYGLVFAEVEVPAQKAVTHKRVRSEAHTGGGYPKSHTNKKNLSFKKQRCEQSAKSYTKARERVDYLIEEIEAVTGDSHSRGGFAKVAIRLPDDLILQILSELKHSQGIRNKGAVFMSIARKYLDKPPSVPSRGTVLVSIPAVIRADTPAPPDLHGAQIAPEVSYWTLLQARKPDLLDRLDMNRRHQYTAVHQKVIDGT